MSIGKLHLRTGTSWREVDQVGSKLVLKLNEVAEKGPEKTKFEVEVDRSNQNWYIQIPNPGQEYRVEYGKMNSIGDFLPVFSTEPVKSHSGSVSKHIDKSWDSKETENLIQFSAQRQALKEPGKPGNQENTTLNQPWLGSASYS